MRDRLHQLDPIAERIVHTRSASRLPFAGYVQLVYHAQPELEFESMAHRGLIGAVLYAKDLRRLAEFYSSVAGIEVQAIHEGYALLGRAPSQFVIVRIPKRIADSIDITTPPVRREDNPIKLVFGVKDIAGARTRAAERGGAVNAVEREWAFKGVKVCDGHDPEGNVFQLRETG